MQRLDGDMRWYEIHVQVGLTPEQAELLEKMPGEAVKTIRKAIRSFLDLVDGDGYYEMDWRIVPLDKVRRRV